MRARTRFGMLALSIGAVAIVGCSTTDNTTTSSGATSAPPSSASGTTVTSAGGAAATSGAAGTVTVKTFQFKPSPLTVKAGSPVTWLNEDDITHEPTSGEPGKTTDAFAAVSLDGKGATGSATIAKPGTYQYFCSFHESMVGEIVVT